VEHPAERLLSLHQVCDQLGISLHTGHKLVQSGRLPCYRNGRIIRFTQDHVRAFLFGRGDPSRSDEHALRAQRRELTARIPESGGPIRPEDQKLSRELDAIDDQLQALDERGEAEPVGSILEREFDGLLDKDGADR
jgi:excisionase family DNA binding protein